MKRFIAILLFLIAFLPAAKAQTKGEIYGYTNPESVIVYLYKDGEMIACTESDSMNDGSYSIRPVVPGIYYDVEFFCKGFEIIRVDSVKISSGQSLRLNIKLPLFDFNPPVIIKGRAIRHTDKRIEVKSPH